MITVAAPLDLDAILTNDSLAFAAGTPVRIATIVRLAVRKALGLRAPDERIERGVACVCAGLERGHFVIQIDGREYNSTDAVAFCSAGVSVRFFLRAYHPKTASVG